MDLEDNVIRTYSQNENRKEKTLMLNCCIRTIMYEPDIATKMKIK